MKLPAVTVIPIEKATRYLGVRRAAGGPHDLDNRALVRRHQVCYTTAGQAEN